MSRLPAASALNGPPTQQVRAIVRRALEEDAPWGDVTTDTLVPAEAQGTGRFVVKREGVVAGLPVAAAVFAELDPELRFTVLCADGQRATAGAAIAEVCGRLRPILTGERTALNLLQRMSGIATAAACYVEAVTDTGARIVDTRKTAPGLRVLDKYAVRCGGASNHRFSLSDAVLVKDNHLAAFERLAASPHQENAGHTTTLAQALQAVRATIPHTTAIEVEVDRLDQIEDALSGGADIILLDNMNPDQLRAAVGQIAGRALTEASGGIDLTTVRQVAETGVDLISIGALTHSVQALDIGLEVVS